MDTCKDIQNKIEYFAEGKLSLKEETAFVKHIQTCKDCLEELEIYYIVKYGLEDEDDESIFYEDEKELVDSYDFKSLVNLKLKKSEMKLAHITKWNRDNKLRYIFVQVVMALTFIGYLMIRYY